MIVAHAPLRISFGGGGTDLPAYYERHGGLVLSTAVDAACHVQVRTGAGPEIVLESLDYRRTVILRPDQPIGTAEPLSLPRAVIAWFLAHDRRPAGMRITMRADVAPGSGLGSSSAMAAALVAGIGRYMGLPLTKREIAEIACEVEIDILGRPIGRQDHYAATYGGLNVLTFTREGVGIAPAPVAEEVVRSLERHTVLISTRRTRDSATVLRSQSAASASDGAVVEALHRIKGFAMAMCDALAKGDVPGFGALLDESWRIKRGLAKGVTSEAIDRWYAIARAEGAYGGKIAGAGGGGHFIFCVPPGRQDRVIAALSAEGLQAVPVAFDTRGCVAYGDLVDFQPSPRRALKGRTHAFAHSNLA
jgi:D-glycero-alpha-D-manno-heptose-7-phosphate kinase